MLKVYGRLVLFVITFSLLLLSGCTHDSGKGQTSSRTASGTMDTTPQAKGSGLESSQVGSPRVLEASLEDATVTKIIDGDTVEVTFDNGQTRKVRYIGIDTPERFEDLYREATQANARLAAGKKARLAKDVSETDRYGRLLRYVYIEDTFVNAELVKQGYAVPATYPPDVKYASYFVKLASQARDKGVGLWSTGLQRAPPPAGGASDTVQSTGSYIGNINSKKFHLPDCYSLPVLKNRVFLSSREEAVGLGYVPCGNCNP